MARRTATTPSPIPDDDVLPAPEHPALGMLPGLVGYRVRLAQMAIFADFERMLADLALTPGVFGLLVIVEANPGLRQQQLADAAQIDRSTLVPALDRLEARALVERRVDPTDRRSNGLFLTADGRALLRRAKRTVEAHETRLASGLSADERDTLVQLLDRVVAALR